MKEEETVILTQYNEIFNELEDKEIYTILEKKYLEIARAWHDFELSKKFLNFCKNKFSSKIQDEALSASGYDIRDLPDINYSQNIKISKIIEDLDKNKFDSMIKDVLEYISKKTTYEQTRENELITLHKSQLSQVNIIEQNINQVELSKIQKNLEIEKTSNDIILEASILFGALLLGVAVAGFWGAFISFFGVFFWRSNG